MMWFFHQVEQTLTHLQDVFNVDIELQCKEHDSLVVQPYQVCSYSKMLIKIRQFCQKII